MKDNQEKLRSEAAETWAHAEEMLKCMCQERDQGMDELRQRPEWIMCSKQIRQEEIAWQAWHAAWKDWTWKGSELKGVDELAENREKIYQGWLAATKAQCAAKADWDDAVQALAEKLDAPETARQAEMYRSAKSTSPIGCWVLILVAVIAIIILIFFS